MRRKRPQKSNSQEALNPVAQSSKWGTLMGLAIVRLICVRVNVPTASCICGKRLPRAMASPDRASRILSLASRRPRFWLEAVASKSSSTGSSKIVYQVVFGSLLASSWGT